MTLLAMGVYVVSCLAQWAWAQQGHASKTAATLIVSLIAVYQVVLYSVLRSGWTLKFKDPALALLQMLFAMLCLGAAYVLNYQVRGTLLMVVALVLVFGAFTLTPGQCRKLGWLAFAILGTVMVGSAIQDPARFPPMIELLNFVFIAITLPLIGQLTARLSQMRFNLYRQKKELRVALEEVKSLATRDQLTGLSNRRHILETVEAWHLSDRHRSAPLCVAVMDLDHFKTINDTFGHPFGDEVLTNFAREALTVMSEGDILSRWGGEEFVVIMPDTPLASALVKIERIHAHMRNPSSWHRCLKGKVNFSSGLTSFRIDESFEQTLARADIALYEAKRLGRDQCFCS